MRLSEFNEGIETLPAGEYRGGKSSLYVPTKFKPDSMQKLPGGSGFMYTVGPGQYGTNIEIWDPKGPDFINATTQPVREPQETDGDYKERVQYWEYANKRATNTPGQLVGKLSIAPASQQQSSQFPLRNAVRVSTITVDEDYRGQGIAKALYGIVLTIMKLPLVAGNTQTPGGRRNWVSLASIPGVKMKGYVGVARYDLSGGGAVQSKNSDKNIDTIMGQLGGDYIGRSRDNEMFFAFDVTPNATGKELEAHVKTKMSKIYGDTDFNSGLYATWSGA